MSKVRIFWSGISPLCSNYNYSILFHLDILRLRRFSCFLVFKYLIKHFFNRKKILKILQNKRYYIQNFFFKMVLSKYYVLSNIIFEEFVFFSVKPGVRYRDLGKFIQKVAQDNGCSVTRSYCGHGIHR